MLTIEAVDVDYGRLRAVDRATVTVPTGEILALLGPSGCGKSTLLRAVAGLEPLAGGRIGFDGIDLADVPVHRRGFGLMFQDGVLFPHRTVAGNIAFGLRMARVPAARSRRRVEELLELVGLPGYGNRRVDELSGGEQQRVALARALAPGPALMLLDEPLAALDAGLRDRLLLDLRSILRGTGTTAVFVTHDQNEAFAVADSVAVMRNGRIEQQGDLQQVWAAPESEWVARFLGYTSVVPAGPDGAPLALRPGALLLDAHGTIEAVVTGVSPRPETTLLAVDTGAWGPVMATAEGGVDVEIGAVVRLTLDPRHTAVLASPPTALPPAPDNSAH